MKEGRGGDAARKTCQIGAEPGKLDQKGGISWKKKVQLLTKRKTHSRTEGQSRVENEESKGGRSHARREKGRGVP